MGLLILYDASQKVSYKHFPVTAVITYLLVQLIICFVKNQLCTQTTNPLTPKGTRIQLTKSRCVNKNIVHYKQS